MTRFLKVKINDIKISFYKKKYFCMLLSKDNYL